MAHRVLVVDDEESITDFLRLGLQYEGFSVTSAATGLGAMAEARARAPDLIILDVMLPAPDGLEVCRRLRSLHSTAHVPILMLTVKDGVADRVNGLDAGADDYMVKPFAYTELLARVRALLRRASGSLASDTILSHAGLLLDRESRQSSRDARALSLTMREFDLLSLLLSQAGKVLSRDLILERVWGYDFQGDPHVVDVYVHYLRQKLGPPNVIQAVRGIGFVLR